jgi:ABC-type Mn2+/Zn2+ transport system ATPase subunit
MIKSIRIENYKALRDVELQLTPIHVLIGPNDTGKTSILEAIAALCRSVDHDLSQAFTGNWDRVGLVWQGDPGLRVSLSATISDDDSGSDSDEDSSLRYRIECDFAEIGRDARVREEGGTFLPGTGWTRLPTGRSDRTAIRMVNCGQKFDDDVIPLAHAVFKSLAGVQYYRWNPSFLALPVAPDSNRRFRMESSGFGLAACLDDILGYDRNRFSDLENHFRNVFPHIRSIKLLSELAYKSPVDDPTQIPTFGRSEGKGIHFEMEGNAQLVPASLVSDGVLLVLAYLAIFYLPNPPRVLLVEEPENGIHPKRLQDVLKILRELVEKQDHTQVIMTTHSPYVVDLFKPNEVTLCQKQDDGSVTTRRLSDSEAVRKQLDVFTLGEIWTSEGDEALAQ